MSAVIIIPARMASSRLPDKPLRPALDGKTLLELTHARAVAVCPTSTYVASSDEEIVRFCHSRSIKCIRTPEAENGTQRTAMALQGLRDNGRAYDVAVNLQCDEPLIRPEDLGRLIKEANTMDYWSVATFVAPLCPGDDKDPSVVKVVGTDRSCQWFTRTMLPGARRHVGVYAWQGRPRELSEYLYTATPTYASRLESLEQITWYYRNIKIFPVYIEQAPPAINTEHDLEMFQRGELK